MAIEELTIQQWDLNAEESLSKIEEGTKFAGKIPGIDLETLTGELQGYFNMGGFDIAGFKKSGRVFAKAYGDYKTGLERILGQFRSNVKEMGISAAKTAAITDFKALCADVSSSAFKAGMMRVGNPADEIGAGGEKIARAGAKTEAGFFSDRLDAALDSPAMDDIITGAYGDSLKSQYYNGMLAGASNSQQFVWRLGHDVEVHCPDCLDLASAGPYRKTELMTVPRGGDTECLWRCDCSLVPIGGVASQVGAGLRPGEENLAANVTSLSGARVPMDTQKLFSDLYDEINKLRIQFEFAVDDLEKKAIVGKKSIIAQQIIDLSNSLSVRVTPVWSLGDLKAIVSGMQAEGFTLLKDITQIVSGAKIWLLQGTSIKTAIVKAISKAGITLDISGKIVVYRTTEDFIGFVK